MSVGAYTSTAEADQRRYIRAMDMDERFGMQAGWFDRGRTRAILKAKGFPRPVLKGLYLRSAVEEWERRQSLPGLADLQRSGKRRRT